MLAVRELAEAILRGLPPDLPDDALTARALFLAGVAALYESGVLRDDLVQMAEGDWNAVDDVLQGALACRGCERCDVCGVDDAALCADDTLLRH